MRKNIVQLVLVHRSPTDVTCYKIWSNFHISVADGCIKFIVDGEELLLKEDITLEIKNVFPDENIINYTTVLYTAPDTYFCKEVYNGDIRHQKDENAAYAYILLKSFMLPHGTYY